MKIFMKDLSKGILAGMASGLGSFLYYIFLIYVEGELGKILASLFFGIRLFLSFYIKTLFTYRKSRWSI